MEDNDINNNLIIKTLRKKQLSTEPRFYVYSYTDPTNNIVRYIGKGCGYRVTDFNRHNSVVVRWCNSLLNNGLTPTITIIKDNMIELDAFNLEKELVKQYGNVFDHTGTLFNFTAGGEGYSGGLRERRSSTLETKEKCRIASTGRKMSDETKRKMSEKKLNIKGTRRTPVIIYGVLYESISEAAIAIGWTIQKLSTKLSKEYCEDFQYQDELKMRLSVANRKNRRKTKLRKDNDLISLNNYKEHMENIVAEKENKINILLNDIHELKQNNISDKLLEELELIRKEYEDFINSVTPSN